MKIRPGFLYVAVMEDEQILKIGFSGNPQGRLLQLQEECRLWFQKRKLKLLGVMPAQSDDELKLRRSIEVIEGLAPRRRVGCRSSHEWYEYTSPVRKLIESLPLQRMARKTNVRPMILSQRQQQALDLESQGFYPAEVARRMGLKKGVGWYALKKAHNYMKIKEGRTYQWAS